MASVPETTAWRRGEPAPDEWVLFCGAFGQRGVRGVGRITRNGGWVTDYGVPLAGADAPTHWMPLPKPPTDA